MRYPIKKVRKAINHEYDIRDVYYIDTDEWFKSIEFPSIQSLKNFLKKEGKI